MPKLLKLVIDNLSASLAQNVSVADTPVPTVQLHPKTANAVTL